MKKTCEGNEHKRWAPSSAHCTGHTGRKQSEILKERLVPRHKLERLRLDYEAD